MIFELSSEEGDTLHDALLEAWDDLRDSTAWSEWYLGVRRKMERPNWTWLIAFGDHSERAFSVTKSEFMLEVPADEVNGAASLQGYMRASHRVLCSDGRGRGLGTPAGHRVGGTALGMRIVDS